MKKNIKILLIGKMYHEIGERILRNYTNNLIILENPTEKLIQENISNVEAVFVRYPYILSTDSVQKSKKLKVICASGIGTDSIDIITAHKKGIKVINNPKVHNISVAEHTIALILSLAKNIILLNNEVRKNNYLIRDLSTQYELSSKTIGIIGLGDIGSLVAKICLSAFNMKVIAYDPYRSETYAKSLNVTLVKELDDLLAVSDIVSLHPSLTKETHHLISISEFKKMKEKSFFINTSRGKVVKEEDLFFALENNLILGAAIDVFENEPPLKNNRLYKLNNIILTAHCAGITDESREKLAISAANQIITLLDGGMVKNIVSENKD